MNTIHIHNPAAQDLQDDSAVNKKEYHTPQVQRYGALSNLVQMHSGMGNDSSIYIDCTTS